jgi:hypothetical protein
MSSHSLSRAGRLATAVLLASAASRCGGTADCVGPFSESGTWSCTSTACPGGAEGVATVTSDGTEVAITLDGLFVAMATASAAGEFSGSVTRGAQTYTFSGRVARDATAEQLAQDDVPCNQITATGSFSATDGSASGTWTATPGG